MKKSIVLIFSVVLILTMFVSGCGGTVVTPESNPTATATDTAMPTLTITITMTPDLCASENIKAEVDKVQKHMREFDDAAILASNVPQGQLSDSIAELQRIRREADDELVPACLNNLKTFQINHMNLVIDSLLAFMRASDLLAFDCIDIESNTEEEAFCQNLATARQQHDQYILELARILGIPIITPGATLAASKTPTP
jgi:hypothetical protein